MHEPDASANMGLAAATVVPGACGTSVHRVSPCAVYVIWDGS